MSKTKDIKAQEDALQLIADYAKMEVRMDIINIIQTDKAKSKDLVIKNIVEYCMQEGEYSNGSK